MKLSELFVPLATFLGGVVSALITASWIYPGTERQTDVQLVQLAIGILSEPVIAAAGGMVDPVLTSQIALRTWAVDIINQSAEVKFDEEAKHLLVNGDASFPLVDAKAQAEALQEAIRAIKAETSRADREAQIEAFREPGRALEEENSRFQEHLFNSR